jgi:hypothetical protein
MDGGFNRDTEPYPEGGGPRVVMRLLRMPVGRPAGAEPGPPRAERKSGGSCSLLATLGRAPAGPVSPDERVRDWSQDLTHPTVRPVL